MSAPQDEHGIRASRRKFKQNAARPQSVSKGPIFETTLSSTHIPQMGALSGPEGNQSSPPIGQVEVGCALAFGRITKAVGQITLPRQETVKLRESCDARARGNFRREGKSAVERVGAGAAGFAAFKAGGTGPP